MDVKHYYNPNGEEILDEEIFGGGPTGFVDFNCSKYHWDSNIELEYGRYLLDQFPIMGVTHELMEQTVYNYAKSSIDLNDF